jgi:hypothetical protein
MNGCVCCGGAWWTAGIKTSGGKKARSLRLKPDAKQRLYRSAESAAPPEFNRNIDLGAAAAAEIQGQH